MLKHAVALAVANQIARRFAYRQRGRRPDDAGILVANINGFGGWIGDRIIRPGRDPVLMTVKRPGKTRAGLGNHESKVRVVRNHIGPGRGRPLAFTQHHDVLAPAMRKATQPVKEGKLRWLWSCLGIRLRRRTRLEGCRQGFFDRTPHELIFQGTSLADDYDPRHRMQQNALCLGHDV